jgi:glycosyltransferase involved in cell wall biosynthesis
MKDVTIVIVAFDRYVPLKNCLRSIRKCYPGIKVIVSDNGKMKQTARLAKHFGCEHLNLEYDCGANLARKLGQAAVKTKYWVIGEDDFIFTKDTVLENFKAILDHDPSVDLVGGLAIRGDRLGTIGSTFEIDRKIRTFYRTPVREPDFRQIGAISYFLCDFTRMFFMARKDIPIDWEEKEYVGSGTHISICLKNFLKKQEALKERDYTPAPGEVSLRSIWPWYQAAFTHSVAVSHVQAPESEGYKKKRSRVRGQMNILYRDTGLRYGVFDGKRVRDYRSQVSISMDEWRRRTGK